MCFGRGGRRDSRRREIRRYSEDSVNAGNLSDDLAEARAGEFSSHSHSDVTDGSEDSSEEERRFDQIVPELTADLSRREVAYLRRRRVLPANEDTVIHGSASGDSQGPLEDSTGLNELDQNIRDDPENPQNNSQSPTNNPPSYAFFDTNDAFLSTNNTVRSVRLVRLVHVDDELIFDARDLEQQQWNQEE